MKKDKILFLIVVGTLAVSLGMNILLFTNNKTSRVGTICGESDISKLNEMLEAQDFKPADVIEVSNEMAKRDEAKVDANCVMMDFIGHQLADKSEEMKSDVERLETLSKDGQNPSLMFNVNYSLRDLKAVIEDKSELDGGRG